MQSKFDQLLDRRGTGSVKWDNLQEVFGTDDLLPMWVADSDWPAPRVVIEAIKERAEHGAFGYTSPDEQLHQTVIDWVQRRYDWEIEPDWLVYTSGVVPAINVAVRAFTHPGDEVIIQSPVYYPFFSAIKNNGAQVANNQLLFDGRKYQMDLDGLADMFTSGIEQKHDSEPVMMILCSPHNPVGRVWTEEELLKLGEICLEHNVLMVSDEIHADLLLAGCQHHPFGRLSDEFARNSITMIAPSKTFNLAGLHSSVLIIPDPEVRAQFQRAQDGLVNSGNVLGFTAMQAAYGSGEDWLEEQLDYLQGNLKFALEYIDEHISELAAVRPEGTYLLWLDCHQLEMGPAELNQFMIEEARVGLDAGTWFGPGGESFMRMNLACPRQLLAEGLQRISQAVRGRVVG